MSKVIRETLLKADSKKQAFYKLTIEEISDGFVIRKESGAGEKVLHKEFYYRDLLEDANEFHQRKIQEKTGENRKRVYCVVYDHKIKVAA